LFILSVLRASKKKKKKKNPNRRRENSKKIRKRGIWCALSTFAAFRISIPFGFTWYQQHFLRVSHSYSTLHLLIDCAHPLISVEDFLQLHKYLQRAGCVLWQSLYPSFVGGTAGCRSPLLVW
jgi:hypothetical protein